RIRRRREAASRRTRGRGAACLLAAWRDFLISSLGAPTGGAVDGGRDACCSLPMIVLREMRRRAKVLVAPVLGLALTGYFAYHLFEGERGLRAWIRVAQELRLAKEALSAAATERIALEHRVAHMRPEQVDPDLLDAQTR